ncbi:hypothetical protein XENORESO_003109 [Xenotaenia resolanae]|uniref:Uncharacterized protein n=1 Tax=Xenotaenia resolanae TaxID=208358 RepID=A0ABV0WQQ2_9TELE
MNYSVFHIGQKVQFWSHLSRASSSTCSLCLLLKASLFWSSINVRFAAYKAWDVVLEPNPALNFLPDMSAVFLGLHDTGCSLMFSQEHLRPQPEQLDLYSDYITLSWTLFTN